MQRIDVTLADHQRAILYRDGVAERWLGPGRHRLAAWRAALSVDTVDLRAHWIGWTPELDRVVPAGEAVVCTVGADEVAALTIDGQVGPVLGAGRYLLWQQRVPVTATLYSVAALRCDLPSAWWGASGGDLMVVTTLPWQRTLVYADGALATVLEPGRALLSRRHREVVARAVDLRETETQIVGQEVMTADRVTLRLNLIVKYRVVDAARCVEAVDDLARALYGQAQMAARHLVGGRTLDALLEARGDAGLEMTAALAARAAEWGVEVRAVDVKDLVLPGEMKTILNRVIEARKQAEANLILRQEETAATRSQANTARMLAQNPVLMRLKELEAIKDIAERIDHVTVLAGADGAVGRVLDVGRLGH